MVAANNDYSTFTASGFWTVAEGGTPVWANLPVVAE